MSEERGFEVVDKRGAREAEEPEPAGAEAEPETPVAADEEAEADAGWGELPNFNPLAGITTPGILQMTFSLLSERAWIDMGLVADPGTGEVTRRIDEAKLAIDVVGDLARHMEPHATPDQRREIQRVVMDLRLNFVRQRDGA
jgi:hypothetical protein